MADSDLKGDISADALGRRNGRRRDSAPGAAARERVLRADQRRVGWQRAGAAST